MSKKPNIAIIGAGLSGLTLANSLHEHANVTVFEKSRGVGGRMSTRYADKFFFDHGAQCFTARTPEFRSFLHPLQQQKMVETWEGKVLTLQPDKKATKRLWFEEHLVASPNMNSLCKHMAQTITVRLSTEVAPLPPKQPDGWHLTDKEGNHLGVFDYVISTAPPVQTVRLFDAYLPHDTSIRQVDMHGSYAMMVGFNKKWWHSWIAAKVYESPIKWISVNSSKPSRNKDVTCLVVHSANEWANEHIDANVPEMQKILADAFQAVTDIDVSKADYLTTHRWRYAIMSFTKKQGYYHDAAQGLACTSDWCYTSRLEEVWSYADKLATAIKGSLNI